MKHDQLSEVLIAINRKEFRANTPDDILELLATSQESFSSNLDSFSDDNLSGVNKYHQVALKLGFWLSEGALNPEGFRTLLSKLPKSDNAGWKLRSPGFSTLTSGPISADLGPILSGPGGMSSPASDKIWEGDSYTADGQVFRGGSMRIMRQQVPEYSGDKLDFSTPGNAIGSVLQLGWSAFCFFLLAACVIPFLPFLLPVLLVVGVIVLIILAVKHFGNK